jgi:uncharacterized protein (DUF2249 family)
MTVYVELDVRPILASGGEPFGEILSAIESLRPGEGLRLIAPFRPAPLFQVLASKGFSHRERKSDGGDWEVLFTRREEDQFPDEEAAPGVGSPWPDPLMLLDKRELDAPEAMVRILEATEAMQPGEVMSALLRHEPASLLPELEKRGHTWRGGFDRRGETYRLLVRIDASGEAG